MNNKLKLMIGSALFLSYLIIPQKAKAVDSSVFLMSGSGAHLSTKELSANLMIRASGGQGINAGEGQLNFNPKEIKITKISLEKSVFDLWIKGHEPKFDNSKGIVTFSGGTTKPLKGALGTIFKLYFKPLKAGFADIKIASSGLQVLSADGLAKNTLKMADDATYIFGNKAVVADAEHLRAKFSGRILLQVEKDGRSWYVFPDDKSRYFLNRPDDAFNLMRKLGVGVKHDYIMRYANKNFPAPVLGKILLDITDSGKAYYINPLDKQAYYLGRPADAFRVMRKLGLGILNKDIRKIPDWAI